MKVYVLSWEDEVLEVYKTKELAKIEGNKLLNENSFIKYYNITIKELEK